MRALILAAVNEAAALAKLAAPLVSGLVVATGMGVADTAMLGPLGAVPLAAVSLASSVLVIFYAGLYGFTGPAGVFAGQAFGADDHAEIGRVLSHATLLGLFVGLLGGAAMALMLLAMPYMGQPQDVLAVITPYWLFMAAMMVPYTVMMAAKQVLDATNRAWLGVLFTVLPILLNIFLNWVFIYGHLGAPALGLTGAGLASFLAQTAGTGLTLAFVRYSPNVKAWWQGHAWRRKSFAEQVREGLPMSLGYFAEGGSVAVAGLMIGLLGTVALAGNQIANAVGSTLYMLPIGMSAAVTIRVAQVIGANERHRAAAIGFAGLGIVTFWLVLFAMLYLFAGAWISRWFVSDEAVIAAAASIFFVFGFMQLMDGIQSVSLGALRGMLDNAWPSAVTIIAYWLIALPLSYLFGITLGYGAPGVWTGFGIGLALAAALLMWRFLKKTEMMR